MAVELLSFAAIIFTWRTFTKNLLLLVSGRFYSSVISLRCDSPNLFSLFQTSNLFSWHTTLSLRCETCIHLSLSSLCSFASLSGLLPCFAIPKIDTVQIFFLFSLCCSSEVYLLIYLSLTSAENRSSRTDSSTQVFLLLPLFHTIPRSQYSMTN